MILSFKVSSGLYLKHCKVKEVDIFQKYWLVCGCPTSHCDLELNFPIIASTLLFKVWSGHILKTTRCRSLILRGDIDWQCRCAKSLCDLSLTFYLAMVTLTCPDYISETAKCRIYTTWDTCQKYWLGGCRYTTSWLYLYLTLTLSL